MADLCPSTRPEACAHCEPRLCACCGGLALDLRNHWLWDGPVCEACADMLTFNQACADAETALFYETEATCGR